MALTRNKPDPTVADADRPPAEPGWTQRTVTSLRDAETLLDWLEAHGYAERELVILGDAAFAVRWR